MLCDDRLLNDNILLTNDNKFANNGLIATKTLFNNYIWSNCDRFHNVNRLILMETDSITLIDFLMMAECLVEPCFLMFNKICNSFWMMNNHTLLSINRMINENQMLKNNVLIISNRLIDEKILFDKNRLSNDNMLNNNKRLLNNNRPPSLLLWILIFLLCWTWANRKHIMIFPFLFHVRLTISCVFTLTKKN